MKFTKENVRQELVAQLTAKGEKLNLSERSINEQVETLIPLIANEESELADFVEKVLPFFKTANANVRNDVAVAIKAYKESEINEGNKEKKQEVATHEESELEKRLRLLEQELADSKRAKFNAEIKSSIKTKLKDKGVKDEEWISALLDEVQITDDFDADKKVDSYLNLYNKMASKVDTDVTPEGASTKTKNERLNDAIKQAAMFAKSQNLLNN